MSINDDAII